VIGEKYPLVVLKGAGYLERTQKNVEDSDGTLSLFTGVLSGGTKLTRDVCDRLKKPFVAVDAPKISVDGAVAAMLRFIDENEIAVLNVAGPRASGWPEGHAFSAAIVRGVIGSQDKAAAS
jgi:hypothetical protein